MEALSLIVGVYLALGSASPPSFRCARIAPDEAPNKIARCGPIRRPPARILELQSQRKRLVMKHQAVRSVDKRIRDLRHQLLREEIAR